MKKFCELLILLVLPFLFAARGYSAETESKIMNLQFSDPSRPGVLKIVNGDGDIEIYGYDGKDVA